ncbi:glycosyltransferase [Salinimicrobium sp. TH3]|uniref:glycosyltransferase n=1 Tax=Salinimicrobium sp. TH3 TaxID=2997342 RepID=UPI0022749F03|nr:glycosyltransferase [Salinimicrobium sp. TH3]MCY2687855.1 glycosyltransferase [Salinimicrobium sp. TH3]
MKNQELISIILPVFNGGKYLEQSIVSCLEQSYVNIELIIIDDCSTDNSLEIAKKYARKDRRVRISSNSENLKLPVSLNIGHKIAKGNYITWTSHDNFYEPEAIAEMQQALSLAGIDIVYSDFNIVEDDGQKRKPFVLEEGSTLLIKNIIGSCFLYKREVYKRNGGYDENLYTIEDYDFWLRSSLHSNFFHLPQFLYNHRSHKESLSSQIGEENSYLKSFFDQGLVQTYTRFFSFFPLTKIGDYPVLFARFHKNEEVPLEAFFRNYRTFRKEMAQLCEKIPGFEVEDLLTGFDLKIRQNIYNYRNNQNTGTLKWILKNRPSILYRFDRRRSLKIIINCLKNGET